MSKPELPLELASPSESHAHVDLHHVRKFVHEENIVTLIDVRTPEEFYDGHIKNAVNIPLDNLKSALKLSATEYEKKYGARLPKKDETIILHCYTGVRASNACKIMEENGYSHWKLYRGSWKEWSQTRHPQPLTPLPDVLTSPSTVNKHVARFDVENHVHNENAVTLIDVRTPEEFKAGHVNNAVNIPLKELEKSFQMTYTDFENKFGIPLPPKSQPLILHCYSGVRANEAFNILDKLGFTHHKLYKGGWKEWTTPPLQRLRAATLKPFGKALSKDNSGTVAIEQSAAIQLGSVDPVQKAAVDEVTTLMQSSQQISVASPTAKRMKAQEAEAARAAKANKAAAAAESQEEGGQGQQQQQQQRGGGKSDNSGAAAAVDTKGMTWAEARAARAAAGQSQPQQQRGGRQTEPASGDGKSTKRTSSGGLIDPLVVRVRNLADVTPNELQRLFGQDNGLGQIARMYLGAEKGIAYITYKNESDARKAIEKMNGKRFKFLILACDHGTKKSGGGGGGGGGRR